uniref:Aftiphilin n=1 Tax=Panagrolaimus sp. ES5 TaxID=591445 RepID=A0AC34FG05_9BILA
MSESDDGRKSESETEESSIQTAQSIKFEQLNTCEDIESGTETAEEISEKKEEDEIQQADIEEEDDDEFGDFEEASASVTTPVKEPDDPFPETPTKNVNFGFAKFEDSPKLTPQRSFESPVSTLPSLHDLINDNLFWEFEDPAATSMVGGSVDGVEYFEPFDDGRFSEDIDLPKIYLNSLKLWSEICFVEDTAALKFQWSKSKLNDGMLAALNMNSAKAAPREIIPLPVLVPTSPSPLQLDLPESRFKPNDELSSRSHSQQQHHQQQQRGREEFATTISASTTTTNKSSPSNATNTDQSLDSLYVQPVNFDWHSSGLSNPLKTGASISDISSVLGCNYETKTDNSFDNAINLDDILRPQTGSNGNKVAELSVDAQALLQALPNYNFMLSKMLMFPLNK